MKTQRDFVEKVNKVCDRVLSAGFVGDQFYTSYPNGTEFLTDTTKRLQYPNEVTYLVRTQNTSVNQTQELQKMKKTIPQLLQLHQYNDKGKKFSTDGTIKEIHGSRGWWYNACAKCKVGVTNDEGVLSCGKCGPTENLSIPWYKLVITVAVADNTREATFYLFGKNVEKLIKISAAQLSTLPSSDKNVVPPIMRKIYGPTYTFTLSINERDSHLQYLTFNISDVYETGMDHTSNIQTGEGQSSQMITNTSSVEESITNSSDQQTKTTEEIPSDDEVISTFRLKRTR
ncbi:uncharacterized protein LOC119995406 [Tripterygium wilfordii]|uniref:uncharacterized protein LOC119995406 n=1 Tax=Tripterygium wilfordii TaxID=458696 RepID=UPI0018F857EB|nr:uncharacterized protein LOC119995406 [Tripterygium wilfordii]